MLIQGTIAKKVVAPAAFSAHARTLRKGSNDHLAIDIDSESDRLIKIEETDEDKGVISEGLLVISLILDFNATFIELLFCRSHIQVLEYIRSRSTTRQDVCRPD